jgi:hypothetical protein
VPQLSLGYLLLDEAIPGDSGQKSAELFMTASLDTHSRVGAASTAVYGHLQRLPPCEMVTPKPMSGPFGVRPMMRAISPMFDNRGLASRRS